MFLAELTTLRLGGPARSVLEVTTEADFIDAVRVADEAGDPALIVGGGSNLVVSDAGFDGTVILVRTRGVSVDTEDCDDLAGLCGGVMVTVQAGEDWDGLVERAVSENWRGFEALSGIPGTVGATPIQNVGAYGQEVSQTIARVRVYDRYDRAVRTMALADCGFGYRTSRFKQLAPRYVVLTVAYQLAHGDLGRPIAYAQLAEALGVEVGAVVPSADVRAAVLDLRRSKGMVLDPDDHDTWSAGSFFTNPVLDAEAAASTARRGATFPAAGRPGQDERGLAHRARRLSTWVPGRRGPGVGVDQALARAHEPRWGNHQRPARSGARAAGRRTGSIRDHPRA